MMSYKPKSDAPPSQETIAALGRLVENANKAGEFIASEGLLPLSSGAQVRLSNGVLTVIDGPYAEAKEVVAGYAIFQLKSKEEAIEAAKRFLEICGDGEVEIRQMMETTDFATAS
jgi:hypothetical protein